MASGGDFTMRNCMFNWMIWEHESNVRKGIHLATILFMQKNVERLVGYRCHCAHTLDVSSSCFALRRDRAD
jgi:hypothetical protein